ncbi:phosphodiester glycosidase family protein [Neotabrizicola shimadae]|uniref:Phosphodiester glycosidase family protein n=1 Tax=Neotabrizicola shimadae TaxID=2807096 RepID=A0A8G1EB50_9RHOB|nr:phosphodiester glycosidase family protein [Neotabrizicola shimadae]QYZ69265.1 phosphodiester glycosidase family protein [Neotabrizicola shimadae]
MMRGLWVALAGLVPGAAGAACAPFAFEGMPYTVCEVRAGEDLRLFLEGPDGVYGSFRAVNAALAAEGKQLGFAMNAGMYHRDLSPVGLYVEDGREVTRLVTRDGPGNFGLLPNGVFCVGEGFAVVESRAFAKAGRACRYATQSGPMLVIDGELHPKLIPDSPSVYVRNGVGVSADGQTAWFAISDRAVNFDSFARMFRNGLGARDALYLDGSISRLYAPELGRSDFGFSMGPIVGTVVPKE